LNALIAIQDSIQIPFFALEVWQENVKNPYIEAINIINQGTYDPQEIAKQVWYYSILGLPSDCNLYGCTTLLREHNNNQVIAVDGAWWKENETMTSRDQLSLPFVLWRSGYKIGVIQYSYWRSLVHLHNHLVSSNVQN
jgi:hypothetical protein